MNDSIISDVFKGSGECLELKNTPTVQKLENANKSCLTVLLSAHPEVRDTQMVAACVSRVARVARVQAHTTSQVYISLLIGKKGATLNKIYNHYIRDDQLKVAIRNYRKPLAICLLRYLMVNEKLKFRPRTEE